VHPDAAEAELGDGHPVPRPLDPPLGEVSGDDLGQEVRQWLAARPGRGVQQWLLGSLVRLLVRHLTAR
jgi:hypothetical protein